MITIQRGNTKLKVSKGAFDLYYKGIGFKIVGVKAEKPAAKAEEVSKPDEKVIDENPVPKADEKPEEKSEVKTEVNPEVNPEVKTDEKSEGTPVEETNKEPKSEGKEDEAPKTPKNENPKK